jgi:transposase
VNTCLQREYGRALRGEPAEDVTRGTRFERVNVIGALCNEHYYAVQCYHHGTDSSFFEGWFEHCLLPAIPAGCTVIMDNARFRRKARLRKLARGKARLLFLPPYSPDYNPIEKTWANMKRSLRDSLQYFQSVGLAIYDYFNLSTI